MDKWIMCIVALILGILIADMLKNVCGCKNVVEGIHPGGQYGEGNCHDGGGSAPCTDNDQEKVTMFPDDDPLGAMTPLVPPPSVPDAPETCNKVIIEEQCSTYTLTDHITQLLNELVTILKNEDSADDEKREAAKSQSLFKLICAAPCITTLNDEYDKCSSTDWSTLSFDDSDMITLIPEILHMCKLLETVSSDDDPPTILQDAPVAPTMQCDSDEYKRQHGNEMQCDSDGSKIKGTFKTNTESSDMPVNVSTGVRYTSPLNDGCYCKCKTDTWIWGKNLGNTDFHDSIYYGPRCELCKNGFNANFECKPADTEFRPGVKPDTWFILSQDYKDYVTRVNAVH